MKANNPTHVHCTCVYCTCKPTWKSKERNLLLLGRAKKGIFCLSYDNSWLIKVSGFSSISVAHPCLTLFFIHCAGLEEASTRRLEDLSEDDFDEAGSSDPEKDRGGSEDEDEDDGGAALEALLRSVCHHKLREQCGS